MQVQRLWKGRHSWGSSIFMTINKASVHFERMLFLFEWFIKCSSSRAPISSFLNARLRFWCLAAVGRLSITSALHPNTKPCSNEGLQCLPCLTAHFRFWCLAASRRNCDISLFHQNTKGVF